MDSSECATLKVWSFSCSSSGPRRLVRLSLGSISSPQLGSFGKEMVVEVTFLRPLDGFLFPSRTPTFRVVDKDFPDFHSPSYGLP